MISIHIMGGLGNQLFQLSAGLNAAQLNNSDLKIEWVLGKPRLDQNGKPEISNFLLPSNVTFRKVSKFSFFLSKVTGYNLRARLMPSWIEKSAFFISILTMVTNIIFSIYFRCKCNVISSKNIGFAPFEIKKFCNYFLIGYFQSYIYAETLKSINAIQSIKYKYKSVKLDELFDLAAVESPLIVHIRLGDYRTEHRIGLLSQFYYSNGIKSQWESGKYNKIWVFSDEIEKCKHYIPDDYMDFVRWIGEVDNSASATLEAMRYGKGYIIGNSSFSWWGAYLSYTMNPQVIHPHPWFSQQEDPKDLLPINWIALDRHELT